ncbi:outer membrane beta-barrel protein [Novosphingobium gossypii]|uniref:outer membrane beta-barrel protein n=1 Tax=Novosphingobium gossypii TaxID=1604774 RepID=UPI003D1F37DF
MLIGPLPWPGALRRVRALWLAAPLVQIALPDSAGAQDRPVEVPETIVEAGKVQGLPVGSFIAFPRVNFDLRGDSNIYDQRNERSDVVAVVRPSLRLESDFARHALRLDAAAEGRRYFDTPAENSNQWALEGSGRLDFADRFVLDGDVGVARRIERRGTFGDQFFTDRPVSYRELSAGARLSRRGGIIEWQAGIDTEDLNYRDARQGGVRADQTFRDVRRDAATLRVDYRRAGRLGLFARVMGIRLDYDIQRGRNSRGFSVLGGVNYRVTDLVRVEAGLGYVRQDTRDSRFADIGALDYHLNVDWTPDARLRLQLRADRRVERSPLAIGAAVLQSTVSAQGTLALGSRTLLGLEAGLLRNRYDGFDRRETRLFAEASLRHFVAPGIAAFAAVSGRRQRGSGTAPREYDGGTARIGVTFAI